MVRVCVFLVAWLAVAGAWAQVPAGVGSPAASSASPIPEIQKVRDAYFRSIALGIIRADEKLVARLIETRRIHRDDLENQAVALQQRRAALCQVVVDKVCADLRERRADLLDATVAELRRTQFPDAMAYVELAKLLRGRLQFEGETNAGVEEAVARALQALVEFLAQRKRESQKDVDVFVARFMAGMPLDNLWTWFSSGGMTATIDTPSVVENTNKLDLNAATELQLREVQGVDVVIARKIIDYRTRCGAFQSIDELDRVPGIGQATIRKLANCVSVTQFRRPEREWTVLIYSAFANDLEWKGLAELNLMERVGSREGIHIVDQIARIDEKEITGGGYDEKGDGNWAGVRRYYVTPDTDDKKVSSPLVAKLGRIDSADPKNLADFCKWAIDLFPARHYWLVIRNHGAGSLGGIASDDTSGKTMAVPELAAALRDVNAFLAQRTGDARRRLDVVNLQACLMGMWEVIHELRDQMQVLIASEATSVGLFEWDSMLVQLVKEPQMPPQELARRVARCRLDGVNALKREDPDHDLTIAAYDMTRLGPLSAALDQLGKALQTAIPSESVAYTDAVTRARSYGDDNPYVDVEGFCENLESATGDPALASAARQARTVLGYPITVAPSGVTHLVIREKAPGAIVWGVNGWATPPPREMWPPGSEMYLQENMVRTRLVGPNDSGEFQVEFPSFDSKALQIRQVNYRRLGARGAVGKERKLFKFNPHDSSAFITQFGPKSPLVAEAHTGANDGSHGIAMVIPVPVNPVRYKRWIDRYQKLSWSKESSWGALLDHIGVHLMPKDWH